MRLLTAISTAALVVSIAAVVLVLGLYAELDKSGSDTPTSDVPLLDEKTVANITYRIVEQRAVSLPAWASQCGVFGENLFQAEYVGKDIWVVKLEGSEESCTFTFHDKEAHVILPQ